MTKEIMEERALALVSQHIEMYPQMRVTDVYKLLYQACMGAEHAIISPETAEDWLMKEWSSISANPDEELYEDLALHHPIFRMNLRPAKAKNISPSKILDAFVKVGNEFPKNQEVLASVWEIVSRKIRAGKISLLDADKIDEFDKLVHENDYPAMHHSKEYAEAYKPTYRLVGRKI